MTSQPEIALVLPSYNPGPELAWTLDSLRAQTAPFKLFLVDDGSRSKPDYPALLQGFPECELIELPDDVGPCLVRNAGVERALAQDLPFIAQMDTGNWAAPERLAAQLRFMKANPDVVIVGVSAEVLHEDMTHSYEFAPPCAPEEIAKKIYIGSVFEHPSMFARADLFRRIGLYTDAFDVAEDYELQRRAITVGKLANLPKILMKRVDYGGGVSVRRRRTQLVSRLRIQWRYRNLAVPQFWLGLGKTLLALAMPTGLAKRLKPLVYGQGDTVGHASQQTDR